MSESALFDGSPVTSDDEGTTSTARLLRTCFNDKSQETCTDSPISSGDEVFSCNSQGRIDKSMEIVIATKSNSGISSSDEDMKDENAGNNTKISNTSNCHPDARVSDAPLETDARQILNVNVNDGEESSDGEISRKRRTIIGKEEGWAYITTIMDLIAKIGTEKVLQLVRRENWDFDSENINLYKKILQNPSVDKNRCPLSMKNYFKKHTKGPSMDLSLMFVEKLAKEVSSQQRESFLQLCTAYRDIVRTPKSIRNSVAIREHCFSPKPFSFQEQRNILVGVMDALVVTDVDQLRQDLRRHKWVTKINDKNLYDYIKEMKGSETERPMISYRSKWLSLLGKRDELFRLYSRVKSDYDLEIRRKFKALVGTPTSKNHEKSIITTPKKLIRFSGVEITNLITAVFEALKDGTPVNVLRKSLTQHKWELQVKGKSIRQYINDMPGSATNRSDESFRSKWKCLQAEKFQALAVAQKLKGRYTEAVFENFSQLLTNT